MKNLLWLQHTLLISFGRRPQVAVWASRVLKFFSPVLLLISIKHQIINLKYEFSFNYSNIRNYF